MLDTISYSPNGDGSFQRLTTHTITSEQVQDEITALQAQLADFREGEQTSDILAAIDNYQSALTQLGAYVTISNSVVWEVRIGGNDTNGGGFFPGGSGTDYSIQNSKNTVGSDISTTDAVAVGTSTLTSATANFSTDIVGNIIYLQGGSGSLAAARYQVTARASTTSITLDRNVASGTGITLNIGGALATPGYAAGQMSGGAQMTFVKYDPTNFSVTSASANISSGCIDITTVGGMYGYDTNRSIGNTDANRPTLKASGISSFTICSIGNSNNNFRNLILDCGSLTSSRGFLLGSARARTYNCKVIGATNSAFVQGSHVKGESTGHSTQPAFLTGFCLDCEAYGGTSSGFNNANVSNCYSYNNSGASSHGFVIVSAGQALISSVAYNNGGDGFNSVGSPADIVGCIAESNSGYGYNGGSVITMFNCAAYGNTSGDVNPTTNDPLSTVIIGTGSFFVNPSSGDFALNSTAGQGAALYAANALYNSTPTGNTVGYLDIGPAQHQSSGGGAALSRVFTGM